MTVPHLRAKKGTPLRPLFRIPFAPWPISAIKVKLRACVSKRGDRCGREVRGIDGAEEEERAEGAAAEGDDGKSLARAGREAVHQAFVECAGECGVPGNGDLAKLPV